MTIILVQAPPLLTGMELNPKGKMAYLRSQGHLVARQDQDSVPRILVSSSPLHIPNLLCCLFING